jgi:ATP-binding cassette, subfamily B, bacterial
MTSPSRLLRPYLTRHWRALAFAALASLAIAVAELARPFPLGLAVDHLIADNAGGGLELDARDAELLAGLGLLVLAIAGTHALASYLSDIVLRRAGERITHELRTATHAHLQRLSLGFHERRHTGDLVTRVTGDVNAVGALFSESLGTIVQATLLLVGMLVVGLIIDPLLALAAFAVSPVLALVTIRFRRRMRAAARRQRAREGEIAALTAESFAAMREVKASGSEPFEHDRLERKSEERRKASMEAYLVEGRFTGAIDMLGAVSSALVLVVGVLRVSSGAISVGDLIVMHSYARRMYRPLRDLARQAGRVSRAMARAERVAAVLGEDAVLQERPGAYRGDRVSGDVALESASFAYADRPVLRDLSLRLRAGERVALVGPSGAGKSTVAALIARFYDPRSGRVLIDGRDARDCSPAWYRAQIGLVLQETILFSGTVADNIAYGMEADPEQIVAAATAAGAHGFISALPDGYDTELGPRGAALSGGERQRIAIARVLLRDPPVLVLDEPTSGLDARNEARVLDGLETLMKGRTTLIITHSPTLAATASRVVALDRGRVVADGVPERAPAGEGVAG